jgi:Ca2+-binding RTX toxin-like protein
MTVFGGSGSAQIQGAAGPSQFVLGIGAATVTAAQGNDVWLASAANDSLVASGGNVILWAGGATGNNVFQAGNGPVTMHGGLGNDTFIGGAGSATITGGGGADVFSFTIGLTGAGTFDQITDFNIQHDTIELHGYAGYTASLVNGSEVLTLSDGTRIQLNGLTTLTGVHISVG